MRMLRSFGWPAVAAMLLVLSGLAGQRVSAQTTTPADLSPVGIWKQIDDKTGEAKSLIEITEAHGELSGKVLKVLKSSKGPNPLCDKCRGALRNQPVNGMEILHGMKPDGSSWSGGTILDPKSGKTYRCDMQVIDGGAKLKVRGYIGFSLFGRTQVWLRESTHVAPAASATAE